jgi:hypothetical protein
MDWIEPRNPTQAIGHHLCRAVGHVLDLIVRLIAGVVGPGDYGHRRLTAILPLSRA